MKHRKAVGFSIFKLSVYNLFCVAKVNDRKRLRLIELKKTEICL